MTSKIGSVVCSIILTCTGSIIPIVLMCLGLLHLGECRVQPWIPMFLVVAGAVGLCLFLLSTCLYGFQENENNAGIVKIIVTVLALLTLFTFAWNITGSVWVFRNWNNWRNGQNTDEGCYTYMYLFAYAYLIIFWITCPCQLLCGNAPMPKMQIV